MKPAHALITIAAAAGLLAAGTAGAHHGFTGRYDAGRPVWLEGQVQSVRFGAPHSVLRLDVAAATAPSPLPAELDFLERPPLTPPEWTGQRVAVEFPPIERFNALQDRLKPGDRVALVAYRNCSTPHQLRVQWVRLPDGGTVVRSGRLQTEVPACGS